MKIASTHLFAMAFLAMTGGTGAFALAAEPPVIGAEPQLFVDDVMIAAKLGVVRRAHACGKLAKPVLQSEMAWEQDGIDRRVYVYGTVLRDPADETFRMWYNRLGTVLFATSDDGIRWNRPSLELVPLAGSRENNILPIHVHSPSVIFDQQEADAAKRYKMIGSRRDGYVAAHSADGLTWKLYPKNPALSGFDTITLSQDPITGEYLAFHKRQGDPRTKPVARQVYLSVSDDMQHWSEPELVMMPDDADHAQTRELEGG
ncbi:MAG: hypothetical protein U1E05_27355, partial [Patescibacteria group bacterium]|nr:hypothetical protein [Patescibacteria group bacterium]